MKKERGINIYLSNRLTYTLMSFLILSAIGMGVFAFGTSSPSTFGHSLGEINLPACTTGQLLGINSSGVWGCLTISGADNLGNHTATQNIRLNGKWLSNDGGNEGINISDNGDVQVNEVLIASKAIKLPRYTGPISPAATTVVLPPCNEAYRGVVAIATRRTQGRFGVYETDGLFICLENGDAYGNLYYSWTNIAGDNWQG